MLPWTGGGRSWWLQRRAVARTLSEEARQADVWHTGVGLGLFDVNALAWQVGARHARGLRVLCLDSDPAAMLAASGGLGRLRAPILRAQLRRHAAASDLTIFIGAGVEAEYGRFARASLRTHAVWLRDDELADEDGVAAKFAALAREPHVTALLATRLTAWKGVDDALVALTKRPEELASLHIDVLGEGRELPRLRQLAARLGLEGRVRFLDPVPYGGPFFSLLRSYPLALVPTRGLEEARIVYDAAASGCVLVHSRTPTLEAALAGLPLRFAHTPSDPDDLAATLVRALSARASWPQAAQAGITFVRGRTIDEMHRERAKTLAVLRAERRPITGAAV
jgi:glycosyltransferase involved in cell wall biosynthesis